jgi:hypothetical protein
MYNSNNNKNNKHPTQQISNCLRELMMSWKLFCCFLATLCFNNITRLLFLDYGVWSKCVCVCVCVCLSLSLSLLQNSTKDPPRTQLRISQQLLTSISNLLATLGVRTSPHQWFCAYFKSFKESLAPLVGKRFFEFFQNQRESREVFGFLKKSRK